MFTGSSATCSLLPTALVFSVRVQFEVPTSAQVFRHCHFLTMHLKQFSLGPTAWLVGTQIGTYNPGSERWGRGICPLPEVLGQLILNLPNPATL